MQGPGWPEHAAWTSRLAHWAALTSCFVNGSSRWCRIEGRTGSLSLEAGRASLGKRVKDHLVSLRCCGSPRPASSADFSLLTHVCCLLWVTVQTFSQEAIPDLALIYDRRAGESQGGTEAAFQTEPSGQIRTKWTTPFILGHWSVCLRAPFAGADASPRAGRSWTGSQAISELGERRDRRCWGRGPVCSSFCVSYRKPIVPSKAEVLLPLSISCLASGSLLEKKKKKKPSNRGRKQCSLSKTHIWVRAHTCTHSWKRADTNGGVAAKLEEESLKKSASVRGLENQGGPAWQDFSLKKPSGVLATNQKSCICYL